MAGLILLEDLGDRKKRNFKCEMAQAGDLDVRGVKYPRMQLLTVGEILEGKRFTTPSRVVGQGVQSPQLPLGLR